MSRALADSEQLTRAGSIVRRVGDGRTRALARCAITVMLAIATARVAGAQSFSTGQVVYAAPSAPAYWYSGCIVGSGRSNASYQVECAGTTYWINGERIRTTAPPAFPDPMRPGQTITPVITPSHPQPAARVGQPAAPVVAATPPAPALPRAGTAAPAPAAQGAVTSAQDVARRIARDSIDAANAVLRQGKYSCYASGRYTFSDLFITGPHSYTVKPGGSGEYSYSHGALTFSSGPYAGAYSRMVDGHTIGVSAKGNTNLGTQCGFEQ